MLFRSARLWQLASDAALSALRPPIAVMSPDGGLPLVAEGLPDWLVQLGAITDLPLIAATAASCQTCGWVVVIEKRAPWVLPAGWLARLIDPSLAAEPAPVGVRLWRGSQLETRQISYMHQQSADDCLPRSSRRS